MLINGSSLKPANSNDNGPRSSSRKIAVAMGLAALLSLCALAYSGGRSPVQPQAPAAPKNGHPTGCISG